MGYVREETGKYFIWLGKGTCCVTKNTVYAETAGGFFVDDRGTSLERFNNCTRWKQCSKYGIINPISKKSKIKEETKMTIIKEVTLINDKQANTYSDDDLFDLIYKIEGQIEALGKIKIVFSAAKKRKTSYRSSIRQLVEILDGRASK